MKITAEFNSNEELLSFIGAFGAKNFKPEVGASNTKAPNKAVVEKKKEDKPTDLTPAVGAEIVSQETPTGEIVDAEITSTEPDPQEGKSEETKITKEETKITKEMVRAVFTKLVKAGKQTEAKELTTKYGASKLPDLKEEHYAAAYKEAEALL